MGGRGSQYRLRESAGGVVRRTMICFTRWTKLEQLGETTMISSKLTLIFLLCAVASSSCQAQESSSLKEKTAAYRASKDAAHYTEVEFKIQSLSKRVANSTALSQGLLLISLRNRTEKQKVIRFCSQLGPAGLSSVNHWKNLLYDPNTIQGQPVQSDTIFYKPTQVGSLGDFAELRYDWIGPNSGKVLSGSYDFSRPQIVLEGEKEDRLMVPIQVPVEKGLYTLNVTFDNRQLAGVVYSRSIVGISEFFEAKDSAAITIK